MFLGLWLAALLLLSSLPASAQPAENAEQALAREVHNQGWIVYGARTATGDWDLFVMRPDGSQVHNLTRTPGYNEGLPRFSADGHKLLYRRLPREERFDNNRHGAQGELMVAQVNGTQVRAYGHPGEYPWACLSPDGRNLAILEPAGIAIIDFASKKPQRRLERKGFFQQITWSPDAQWLCGVANSYGTGWSVARMNVATGAVNPVSTVDCCTPDWWPDSKTIVFSRRPGEWTQLWRAEAGSGSFGDKSPTGQSGPGPVGPQFMGAGGSQRTLLYAEDGRHVYGGCVSPDGKYVLFTGNKEEDGDPKNGGAPMGLMRLADAPIVGGDSVSLRSLYPLAKSGPVLRLPSGWEPHWALVELKFDP